LRRDSDADSATVVRFQRAGVANAGLTPETATVRVVFPHRSAQQEQVVGLPVGEWLVDWAGADALARLQVGAGAHPQVQLTTTSGACQLKNDGCELVPMRARHISIDEGARR
jgi:hypothetical protein